MKNEEIILGSGDVYLMEYSGDAIPEDNVIETEANIVGNIQGGASLEYKPTDYSVMNDKNEVLKRFITEEEVTFKSGVLTWGVNTLQKLCAGGELTEDAEKHIATLKIGGRGKTGLARQLVRFVHTFDTGLKFRVTLVATASAGFTLAFAKDKETVVDAEFKAVPHDDEGTLVEIKQDLRTPVVPPVEG